MAQCPVCWMPMPQTPASATDEEPSLRMHHSFPIHAANVIARLFLMLAVPLLKVLQQCQ